MPADVVMAQPMHHRSRIRAAANVGRPRGGPTSQAFRSSIALGDWLLIEELPLWRANKAAWEPGIRTVGLEEMIFQVI